MSVSHWTPARTLALRILGDNNGRAVRSNSSNYERHELNARVADWLEHEGLADVVSTDYWGRDVLELTGRGVAALDDLDGCGEQLSL